MKRTDYHWRDDIREGNAAARSVGWRAAIWIAVIVAFIGLISGGVWLFKVVTSPVKGAGDQAVIVNEGRNRVNAQEWFHGQYQQIKATDKQINESAVNLAAAKNEADRLFWRDTLTGQRNRCAQMVGEYNAEALKVSRGQWRDPNLPTQIDDTDPATDCQETVRTKETSPR